MHEVLVNRLGGLSLPRKSVVRLTDRPDMTLDVYRGRKTTMQQQQKIVCQDPRWLCPYAATVVQGSNSLYTGRLFHCYMLDKSICHFRGSGSISSLLFYFDGKS